MSTSPVTPAALIAAIQTCGSDATTLRDAAHEAHHALEAGVPAGRWDRETIHRAVLRLPRRLDGAMSEITARAVEQIVCQRLGVDPGGDVESWALISCMEAMKSRVAFFDSVPTVVELVRRTMDDGRGQRAADAVMALAARPEAMKRRRPLRRAAQKGAASR